MAFLDPSKRDLYVACTGDSRAIAGIWEETDDGTGKWRVEVLTEDQTGRNENEAKRLYQIQQSYAVSQISHRQIFYFSLQLEHPTEDVIARGRILGGLEPSRAFGDARYKWPREVQETLRTSHISVCVYLIGSNLVTHHLQTTPSVQCGRWQGCSSPSSRIENTPVCHRNPGRYTSETFPSQHWVVPT
jgi:serine/threonine protein phosphatase PrpC